MRINTCSEIMFMSPNRLAGITVGRAFKSRMKKPSRELVLRRLLFILQQAFQFQRAHSLVVLLLQMQHGPADSRYKTDHTFHSCL